MNGELWRFSFENFNSDILSYTLIVKDFGTKATSVFKDPGVAKTQFIIQGKCVVVPVDNTPNHTVLVSKKHVL
jgi:hypothetical protein